MKIYDVADNAVSHFLMAKYKIVLLILMWTLIWRRQYGTVPVKATSMSLGSGIMARSDVPAEGSGKMPTFNRQSQKAMENGNVAKSQSHGHGELRTDLALGWFGLDESGPIANSRRYNDHNPGHNVKRLSKYNERAVEVAKDQLSDYIKEINAWREGLAGKATEIQSEKTSLNNFKTILRTRNKANTNKGQHWPDNKANKANMDDNDDKAVNENDDDGDVIGHGNFGVDNIAVNNGESYINAQRQSIQNDEGVEIEVDAEAETEADDVNANDGNGGEINTHNSINKKYESTSTSTITTKTTALPTSKPFTSSSSSSASPSLEYEMDLTAAGGGEAEADGDVVAALQQRLIYEFAIKYKQIRRVTYFTCRTSGQVPAAASNNRYNSADSHDNDNNGNGNGDGDDDGTVSQISQQQNRASLNERTMQVLRPLYMTAASTSERMTMAQRSSENDSDSDDDKARRSETAQILIKVVQIDQLINGHATVRRTSETTHNNSNNNNERQHNNHNNNAPHTDTSINLQRKLTNGTTTPTTTERRDGKQRTPDQPLTANWLAEVLRPSELRQIVVLNLACGTTSRILLTMASSRALFSCAYHWLLIEDYAFNRQTSKYDDYDNDGNNIKSNDCSNNNNNNNINNVSNENNKNIKNTNKNYRKHVDAQQGAKLVDETEMKAKGIEKWVKHQQELELNLQQQQSSVDVAAYVDIDAVDYANLSLNNIKNDDVVGVGGGDVSGSQQRGVRSTKVVATTADNDDEDGSSQPYMKSRSGVEEEANTTIGNCIGDGIVDESIGNSNTNTNTNDDDDELIEKFLEKINININTELILAKRMSGTGTGMRRTGSGRGPESDPEPGPGPGPQQMENRRHRCTTSTSYGNDCDGYGNTNTQNDSYKPLQSTDYYALYDVWNPGLHYGGQLNISDIGQFTFDDGLQIAPWYQKSSTVVRRKDMKLARLRTMIVVSNTNYTDSLEHYLATPYDTHLDSMNRFNFALLSLVRDFYNFSMILTTTTSWGYLKDGKFDGMIGAVVRKQADICGSPIFFRIERARVIDYTARAWVARPCFIFRHPQNTKTDRIVFLQPFENAVWLFVILAGIATILLLWMLTALENHLRRPKAKQDEEKVVAKQQQVRPKRRATGTGLAADIDGRADVGYKAARFTKRPIGVPEHGGGSDGSCVGTDVASRQHRRQRRRRSDGGQVVTAAIKRKSYLSLLFDSLIFYIGSICQQGLAFSTSFISGRCIVVTSLLFSFAIFQFYSASVVGTLLMERPKTIRTLRDLTHSSLDIGIEDLPYTRDYFRRTKDPDAIELYVKKIAINDESTVDDVNKSTTATTTAATPTKKRTTNTHKWFEAEEGIAKLQKGKFAFHVDVATAYKIISETFSEREICDLSEIPLFPTQKMVGCVQKGSPVRKMLTYGLRRLFENGLMEYQRKVWLSPKPRCVKQIRSEDLHVDMETMMSALFLLLLGYGFGLCCLCFEILYEKLQRLRVH